MARKKYRDYKNDSYVKTPLFAWLLDRSVIYIALAAVAVVFTAGFLKSGYDSFQRVMAEPEIESPYLDIVATNSPGMDWAYSLISKKPLEVDEWTVSESRNPRHVFDVNKCSGQGEIPASVLAAYSASGGGVETRIQVYGAGQASAQLNAYKGAYNRCFKGVEDAGSGSENFMKFNNGFVVSLGDSIIGVITSDAGLRDELFDYYVKAATDSLMESGCVALSVKPDDNYRNFFYYTDSYTGLLEKKTVESQVSVDNLPTVEPVVLDVLDSSAVEPEAPLPGDFPKLPEEVKKPVVPAPVESVESFDVNAYYEIVDDAGPGCGWEWSAQRTPLYDMDLLDRERESSISAAQAAANKSAADYVQSKRDWAYDTALVMPLADSWNKYVKRVVSVHEKWDWLNTTRDEIRQSWYNYVSAYDAWLEFDDIQASALEDYDSLLEVCKSKQDELTDWEVEWGALYDEQNAPVVEDVVEDLDTDEPTVAPSPTPSPTPTVTIPDRPEGCSDIPVRPSILDQVKPDEPVAPSVPAGVTIPDSWPQPGQN